ncbi:MAG: phosphatidic acid phosphatase, partial [Eudoraea sp.]|nr:phosphatidic acid phosphatase [Eudoraea sp.]
MKKISVMVCLAVLAACTKQSEPIVVSPDELHNSIDKVVEIMIHDIFSPPVASRIFAYPNIAAYEIIALENEKFNSLV